MPAQDTTQIKEKIMIILRRKGPSLPVHIAGETGLSILFASAFLSELIADRKIKISNLRVGNSPLYFIPGQEPQLEKFSHHLKSKEKDAYLLLKEKKFLNDETQEPAIRVALRAIKDFAFGFRKNGKIFWRFFTVPESEFQNKQEAKQIEEKPEEPKIVERENKETPKQETEQIKETITIANEIAKEKDELTKDAKTETLNIFENEQETRKIKKKAAAKKKTPKKKTTSKKDENFFNTVKEFLNQKSIDIVDIESFNKSDLILRIKKDNEELLLVAYNRKKLAEEDIIKANKRASELNLKYIVFTLGGPSKKLENLIEAVRNLKRIEKFP